MTKAIGAIVLAASLIYGLSGMVHANCGNDNSNGNGCSGNTGPEGPAGPQGPTGPQGQPGSNGSNGTNGTNGVNGATGAQGPQGPNHVDPRMNEARLGLDAAIRLYDGKRVQLQAYNIWSPSLHNSEDAVGDGRNLQFGMRFVFKLGSSYEERLLEAQKREIEALKAVLEKVAQ